MFTSRFSRLILIALVAMVILVWIAVRLWHNDQNKPTAPKLTQETTGILSERSSRSMGTDFSPPGATSPEEPQEHLSTSSEEKDQVAIKEKTSDLNEKSEFFDQLMKDENTVMEDENTIEEETADEKASDLLAQKKTVKCEFGGIPVELEIGKKYRITRYGVGTWNPRPMTKEEEKRFAELTQEFSTRPPLERRREISAELNEIKAETSYPSKIVSVLWLPLPGQKEEPPDDEIIDIDLTR